jgi:two-component system alkaline phosphatase synthesis response regulator PhoP
MTAKHILQVDDPGCKPSKRKPNARQRILVVEDNRDIRRLSAEILIDSGYHVDAAENGSAAWDRLQLKSYDLLITDQHMPKLSGVELLKKIYTARMTLPIIMATGILPTWEFAMHPWLLPARMLLKPYTLKNLLGMVKNVLHETTATRAEIAPLTNWQNQPLTGRLRL